MQNGSQQTETRRGDIKIYSFSEIHPKTQRPVVVITMKMGDRYVAEPMDNCLFLAF